MDKRFPEIGSDGSILEGIVTTINDDRSVNISPMGPIVDHRMNQLLLRPFRSSTTYHNLKRTGQGVFHVTDDVHLFAQAALGQPDPLPNMTPAKAIDGFILGDACRWYALQVVELDDSHERTEISARTVDRGRLRDFFGFHRARHAVIEAAILATRVHLLPTETVMEDLKRLEIPLRKTASRAELDAFSLLKIHIHQALSDSHCELARTKNKGDSKYESEHSSSLINTEQISEE